MNDDKIRILPRKKSDFSTLAAKIEKADIAAIGHYTEFGFMRPDIRPVRSDSKKIFGPAVTVRTPAQDSKSVHIAVSLAEEGDIVVIDRSLDQTHACVGEMVALCAATRKIAGIIVDGPITDLDEILEIGIPVYSTGVAALTTKFIGSTGEINDDISCGGVVIHPGDLIIADGNGVLVLREFEAERLIDVALADHDEEAVDKDKIIAGATLEELYCR